MAPGERIEGLRASVFEPFDDEMIKKLRDGSLILWIYGRIEYFDFAAQKRVMNFCYRYFSSTNIALKIDEGFMSSGPPSYRAHT
jgi:hypothetical protein